MSHIVAVDIGGTHIRVALYEPGSITPISHQRTRSLADEPGVYDRLAQAVESVWPQDHVAAIGIASPGPLDPHTGTILATPNIPEWKNFPLTSKLSKQFGVPAYLDNDANMAGLAEWQYGAGQGHQDLVYLTISTGIGGGVISNGCLLQGFHGMGAELGHMIVDPDGPLCGCGRFGHVESFSSGPAIARYVSEQIQAGHESVLQSETKLTAAHVAEAARGGDALAVSAFERAGHYLDDLVITQAALGDNAGLLGALALARLASSRVEG